MSEPVLPRPVDSPLTDRLHAVAAVRTPAVDGEVSNISPEGCCVRLAGPPPGVGTWIVVQPDGLEPRVAVVRWIAGNLVGVEFDRSPRSGRRPRRRPLEGVRIV